MTFRSFYFLTKQVRRIWWKLNRQLNWLESLHRKQMNVSKWIPALHFCILRHESGNKEPKIIRCLNNILFLSLLQCRSQRSNKKLCTNYLRSNVCNARAIQYIERETLSDPLRWSQGVFPGPSQQRAIVCLLHSGSAVGPSQTLTVKTAQSTSASFLYAHDSLAQREDPTWHEQEKQTYKNTFLRSTMTTSPWSESNSACIFRKFHASNIYLCVCVGGGVIQCIPFKTIVRFTKI